MTRTTDVPTPAGERTSLTEDLLRNLSHELRTPLTAILGWSWLLRSHSSDPAAVLHAADVIERNARAEAQIVDDLLDASTIMAGRMHIVRVPISFASAVTGAIESLQCRAGLSRVTLTSELAHENDAVCGAPDRLQRVVWHLLSNAIKFSREGGTVHVTERVLGETIELRVTDDGQGISNEGLAGLFARARQGDASNTRRHGGLGLGLAITRHLVEMHGGHIRAESAGLGQGSTFVVTLPRYTVPVGRISRASLLPSV